jgi:hypothetical protein
MGRIVDRLIPLDVAEGTPFRETWSGQGKSTGQSVVGHRYFRGLKRFDEGLRAFRR